MKILQINASYKPAFIYGGPTMSVSKLSEVLVSKGITLDVLTTSANGSSELDVPIRCQVQVDKVPVTYFRRLTKDHTHFSPALYRALWNALNTARGNDSLREVVHIHTWWNLVSVISCFIALLKGTSVLLSPRGTLSSYSFGNRSSFFKKILFALTKPLLRRCHMHATSENEKEALLSLITPKSITVIPNIVNLPSHSSIDKQAIVPHSPLKLLFFSRVEQKKGLELLFNALSGVTFDYTLTIAGPGDAEYISQLQSLSRTLQIASKINWIGNQAPELKFKIMAAHDLLVLPSYDENFANVVVESLFAGTAVLLTENVGLSDYVLDKGLGWVCRFDEQDLRKSLIDANDTPDRLEEVRRVAPSKIKIDFSEDELASKYIDLYHRILKNV